MTSSPLLGAGGSVGGEAEYYTYLRCNKNYNCYLVFGRFPAELGPETRSNGPGSKNGAESTHN